MSDQIDMSKRSKYRIGIILALDKKWTTETKIEVEIKDMFNLSDMIGYHGGLVECRGKYPDSDWEMDHLGSRPSFCQWRLTKAGLTEKKSLQDEGWYLG